MTVDQSVWWCEVMYDAGAGRVDGAPGGEGDLREECRSRRRLEGGEWIKNESGRGYGAEGKEGRAAPPSSSRLLEGLRKHARRLLEGGGRGCVEGWKGCGRAEAGRRRWTALETAHGRQGLGVGLEGARTASASRPSPTARAPMVGSARLRDEQRTTDNGQLEPASTLALGRRLSACGHALRSHLLPRTAQRPCRSECLSISLPLLLAAPCFSLPVPLRLLSPTRTPAPSQVGLRHWSLQAASPSWPTRPASLCPPLRASLRSAAPARGPPARPRQQQAPSVLSVPSALLGDHRPVPLSPTPARPPRRNQTT